MDKSISSKRSVLVISSVVVVIMLTLSFLYLPSYFEEGDDDVDKTDWESYPYEIPETDMRFPDEEGRYPKEDEYVRGDTWISIGMRIDFLSPDLERTYLVLLYHDDYKDVFLSSTEETHKERFVEEETGKILPEGRMNMTFRNTNTGLPEDRLQVKEGEAFHYDFISHFELDGTLYELDLELEAEKPPATMTDFDGEVRFDENYYRIHSLTHVDISGTIELDEKTHEVDGLAWIENQRGSSFAPPNMEWDWIAFWDESGVDMKIVDVYSGFQNKEYAMYVDVDGNIVTMDDISIEVTSVKNGFGYSWEISSETINLNITCIDDRMDYEGFGVGVGTVSGYVMGIEIDTLAYLELTKPRQPGEPG